MPQGDFCPVHKQPASITFAFINLARAATVEHFQFSPAQPVAYVWSNGDSIAAANCGWLEDFDDRDHLILHIKGIPHDC